MKHLIFLLIAATGYGAVGDSRIFRDAGAGFSFGSYVITNDSVNLLDNSLSQWKTDLFSSAADINAATADTDFMTLTGDQTATGAKAFTGFLTIGDGNEAYNTFGLRIFSSTSEVIIYPPVTGTYEVFMPESNGVFIVNSDIDTTTKINAITTDDDFVTLTGAQSIGGVKTFTSGVTLEQWMDLEEVATPAAPAADTARIYAKDNGSGKTQLVVLFPTGAEQIIATQP